MFDYDVESVDDNEITEITDLNDGKQEEAFVCKVTPDFNVAIKLDDVFGFQD